mmetsp:Transcript_15503/g.46478  ORF Transcript_15503/g.46478 Transcript_15503/m.46478 type:complete len:116 (-) Transcript_15503:13-360(-)
MSLHDARTILRMLNKWPSTSAYGSPFKTHLRASYRRHRDAADATALQALRRQASDYARLLQGVEEQKRLRALDTGAEITVGVREAMRASAVRSGVLPPEESDAPFTDLNRRDLNG